MADELTTPDEIESFEKLSYIKMYGDKVEA